MTQRMAWGALLAACLAGLVAFVVAEWHGNPAMASTLEATSQAPARHCIKVQPAIAQALRRGDTRVVVVVKAFVPPKPAGGGLVVWLLPNPASPRQEISRFAVFPLRAISSDEPARAQRFLVSVAEQAQLIKDDQPICLEIGFDRSAGQSEGGMAAFEIDLVDMPPAAKR